MPASSLRGRELELARARAILSRSATTGQGGVIVVSGEAGIGKSALLAAISGEASQLEFGVGTGKAEERDQIAPMAPLLVALRSGPAAIFDPDAFAQLAPLYGQQLWLVDRLTCLLEERAQRSPLLIVVDDIQWIDRLSAFALRVLIDHLAGFAIVWLFASRLYPASGNNTSIADVIGQQPFETIELGPLDIADVIGIAEDRRGVRPSGRLLELLSAANGFPFLIVELLDGFTRDERATGEASARRSSRPDERELPIPLIVGVRSRLQSLTPETLRLVQVASIFGRSFDLDDAAALLNLESAMLALPALRSAVDAGVLEDRGAQITFRHDLFRQAVYEDIPRQLALGLHRAAAARLMATLGPLDAAPHVLVYAKRGDREAAEVLWRAAIQVTSTMPVMAVELIERAFVLLDAGDPSWTDVGLTAMSIMMEARRGKDAVAIADQLLVAGLPNETAARVQVRVGRVLYNIGHIEEARARVDETVGLAGLTEQTQAALMALQALMGSIAADSHFAVASGEAALRASRHAGNEDAEADALLALAENARNDGRNVDALGHFRDLRLLKRGTPPADEIIALQLLDQYEKSQELLNRAYARSDDRRTIPNALSMGFAQMWQSYHIGVLDDLEADARSIIQLCEDIQEHSAAHEAKILLSRAAQMRGDLPAARAHLASAQRHPDAAKESWSLRSSFMEAFIAETERDAAAAVRAARDFVQPPHGFRHRWRWAAWWLITATRIAVQGGDRELAAICVCDGPFAGRAKPARGDDRRHRRTHRRPSQGRHPYATASGKDTARKPPRARASGRGCRSWTCRAT
jgi:tetratricopeptide (TPR) repeat protein